MAEKKKGLVLVFTGNGKGKTTAALGMAFRAWGQNLKVLILQFIKGGWKYGELKAVEKLEGALEIRQLGEGFIEGANDNALEEHRNAARHALAEAKNEIESGAYNLIILDEVLYAVHYGLIDLRDVLSLLARKKPGLHLVLTGRYVTPEIIEKADLVTEMKEVKHHYRRGISAQKGIEY
jgi:cob(I)alamin adenosyltransferase